MIWNSNKYVLDGNVRYRLFPSSRLIITLLCFGIAFVQMANFSSMNFTMTCMVAPIENTTKLGTCNDTNTSNSSRYGNLPWSRTHQSIVLSGNGIGSFLTVFIAGYYTDKYGARYIGIIASVLFTITALIIPITANHSWWAVLIVRIVQGVGVMTSWPLFLVLASQWFPLKERGILTALGTSGQQVGNIFANLVASGTCQAAAEWPLFFYILGCIDALFLVLWVVFYRDRVDTCWHTSEAEASYILRTRQFTDKRHGQGQQQLQLSSVGTVTSPKTPWRSILTSAVIWSIIFLFFGIMYVFYFIGEYTPLYYKEVLDIDITASGIYSALPSLLQFFGRVSAGPIGEFLDRKYGTNCSIKIMSAIAGYGSGIFILAAVAFDCHKRYGAVICICISYFVFGYSVAGFSRASMLVAPGYVGTITGIMQTSNYASALVVPYISGAIIGDGAATSIARWHISFYVAGAVALVSTTVFILFGSGEVQDWATDPKPYSQTIVLEPIKSSEEFGDH